MPNPVYVLPDPVLATLQYLRARPEVTALVASGNVLTKIPATPNYPYVLVTAAGSSGESAWPAVDDAAVQIDVVSNDPQVGQQITSAIARTVRAAVWAIANDTVPAGCLASGWDEIAPQWFPDPVTTPPLARFTARYRIILHP